MTVGPYNAPSGIVSSYTVPSLAVAVNWPPSSVTSWETARASSTVTSAVSGESDGDRVHPKSSSAEPSGPTLGMPLSPAAPPLPDPPGWAQVAAAGAAQPTATAKSSRPSSAAELAQAVKQLTLPGAHPA